MAVPRQVAGTAMWRGNGYVGVLHIAAWTRFDGTGPKDALERREPRDLTQ
jgi:hypothetical protein